MTTDDYSFTKFSRNSFYEGLNAQLVDMADLSGDKRIVDLACGTGGVTGLIVERLNNARESVVIAVDHSAGALKQAMENLKDRKDAAIQFVHSQVEGLSGSLKESVDTVVFCNAIHYIPDKDALLDDIAKSLNPGGKFAFNTSFYEGSHPPESLEYYRKWMFKSIRTLRREYGLMPDADGEGGVAQATDGGAVPRVAGEARHDDSAAEHRDGAGADRGLAGHQRLSGLHRRDAAGRAAGQGERGAAIGRAADLRRDGDYACAAKLAGDNRGQTVGTYMDGQDR